MYVSMSVCINTNRDTCFGVIVLLLTSVVLSLRRSFRYMACRQGTYIGKSLDVRKFHTRLPLLCPDSLSYQALLVVRVTTTLPLFMP